MNKIGLPTYLGNENDYLMVVSAEIEGGHGLPLGSNYLLEKFQNVIKAVNFWCGDNEILKNVAPQLFTPSHQEFQ